MTIEETAEPHTTRCEVVIAYCDDTKFKHGHTTVETAAIEYSQRAYEAIVDEMEEVDKPKHIRSVHLLVFHSDGSQLLRSHLDTGVLPCSHTTQ